MCVSCFPKYYIEKTKTIILQIHFFLKKIDFFRKNQIFLHKKIGIQMKNFLYPTQNMSEKIAVQYLHKEKFTPNKNRKDVLPRIFLLQKLSV